MASEPYNKHGPTCSWSVFFQTVTIAHSSSITPSTEYNKLDFRATCGKLLTRGTSQRPRPHGTLFVLRYKYRYQLEIILDPVAGVPFEQKVQTLVQRNKNYGHFDTFFAFCSIKIVRRCVEFKRGRTSTKDVPRSDLPKTIATAAMLLTYSSDFGAARLGPCELRTVVPYTYTSSERSAELHETEYGNGIRIKSMNEIESGIAPRPELKTERRGLTARSLQKSKNTFHAHASHVTGGKLISKRTEDTTTNYETPFQHQKALLSLSLERESIRALILEHGVVKIFAGAQCHAEVMCQDLGRADL
ncbi:hypothetical protein EVAR_40623_1 [Eumeta japonica]|uniref:Uncharacterized protein n=1 Tax=Eumeta variegata TaxID=151549 RepID=A0A4C1XGP6_EUMVA|nr:hypothetical protein EVAR_40623_1 [Eumeta japonica]